ncbi:D-alanyl-D-alanine carboxypeptidase family protein [Microbacterium sp. 179-I 3D4 NHS]|uniref:D-alanyl-D-alanine carboxypeptidase family protein n=1 Tax=Microbacterium sp. 179-I 3D4 NHS TaxID=3142381 RepID=UPI0039A22FA4
MTAPDAAEATASDEPVAAARDPRFSAESETPETDAEPAAAPAEGALRREAIARAAASDARADAEPEGLDALAAEVEASAQWADETRPATALTWVDPTTVAAGSADRGFDQPLVDASGAALLRGARLRPAISRPSVWGPFALLILLAGSYTGTTLLWPLHEVAPTVEPVEFSAAAAPAAAPVWPGQGSAAIGVGGMSTAASSPDAASIASITKVVSALMVLDRMPLAPGEQGPSFSFTRADSQSYWSYRRADQSALDVPVGGTLTEYQLLQGTLLGSANNYIDRLATEIWGSRAAFADAAAVWLRERGLQDITIVTPSGFDEANTASPEALVRLGELAMKNPVFAEIVGTPSVELPGAGVVTNTNGMLADPGVVGIKTGTLVGWNLLTAKDVTIDDTTVRLYAAVLNQDDDDQRLAATRSLFAEVEAALAAQDAAVPEGTVVGQVQTEWGEEVDIVTDADADVVLWNGAVATTSVDFSLGDERQKGDAVGSLSTAGPLNSAATQLSLASDVEGPSPWWRLTHPFELFGIDED